MRPRAGSLGNAEPHREPSAPRRGAVRVLPSRRRAAPAGANGRWFARRRRFVLHKLTNIVETLAADYEAVTTALLAQHGGVVVTAGMFREGAAVYADLTPSGAVELYWLDTDR